MQSRFDQTLVSADKEREYQDLLRGRGLYVNLYTNRAAAGDIHDKGECVVFLFNEEHVPATFMAFLKKNNVPVIEQRFERRAWIGIPFAKTNELMDAIQQDKRISFRAAPAPQHLQQPQQNPHEENINLGKRIKLLIPGSTVMLFDAGNGCKKISFKTESEAQTFNKTFRGYSYDTEGSYYAFKIPTDSLNQTLPELGVPNRHKFNKQPVPTNPPAPVNQNEPENCSIQ
ncbi:hypothetical protein BN59_01837 [Legionella massiliensis]|uniref:Uncharacterized protein n=1 Tax=Legionella massiliensis TaxID=1034943 RepID=A0A078L0I1_9GAMM|nr:hypothetical protein [Legionella massiliensis]CDZ77554.1 hypothetical protein BN59_01837 [Legionella massiliensis]CEE13292.1 hypothetical protein BN1094_01837 [Legionella massiliensis]